MILSVAGIIIGVVAIVAVIAILFAMSYVKAGPDTAIMVSGAGKKKILIGRAGIRIPFLQRTDKLSLKAFQVDIKTEEAIPTKEFININVDGVANLKVSSDPELLAKAFESILNMDERELQNQLQQVLQGNMREIVGTVEIKELVRDRQGVANKVKENVVPDMAKLGIEVVNFNIQSFSDDNKVIENLGIDNIFAEDVIYTESWGPKYNNRQIVKHWFQEWNTRGKVVAWEIKQFFHKGNQTIVEWYFKNEMNNGSIEEFDGISLVEWTKDNKIKSLKEFGCNLNNYNPYEHSDLPEFRDERASWF